MPEREVQLFFSKRFKYLHNYTIVFLYTNITLFLMILTLLYYNIYNPFLILIDVIIFIEIIFFHHIRLYTKIYEYEARNGQSIYYV
jgi:hypothetical protein